MQLDVALLGFGNVGRSLGGLLLRKRDALQNDYGLTLRVVGISTGRHGQAIDPEGIDMEAALSLVNEGKTLAALHQGAEMADTPGFLAKVPAQLLFETIPTNPHDGQPAFAYLYGALERGIHVVTANKGPIAFGYQELTQLARRKKVGFLFESTVLGGSPVHALLREAFPGAEVKRIRGVLNSTTNYILDRMEQAGLEFDAALKQAQEIGVAETDPTLDIDGWDAAIKITILANVWMGAELVPADVDRTGIAEVSITDLRHQMDQDKRTRLVCEAWPGDDGKIKAKVAPQALPLDDLMTSLHGTDSLVQIETDTLPMTTLIDSGSGKQTTAYGMFVDMLNILRGRHDTSIKR
ncbi:MAG: homoserine dehydrogenase [Chloroflexi bacterium]|nr:homoserine dehydrogenase [Chloroflexota bacterium]